MASMFVYELRITLKNGHIVGGGLPHYSYVDVSIDGKLFARTEKVLPSQDWNKLVLKKFHTLEPRTPIIISFSAYKKRWTSSGYKLVGTAQFPLLELYSE